MCGNLQKEIRIKLDSIEEALEDVRNGKIIIVVDDEDPDAFPLGIISSFDIVAEMARPGSIWQS